MSEQNSRNLFEVFRGRFPSRMRNPFITTGDGRVFTYDDLDRISAQYANVLIANNVKPGDRVAVQIEKSPEGVFLYLACLRAGAVFLPLNTAYRADEADYFLGDAEPGLVVGDPGAHELANLCVARKIPHFFTLGADGVGTLINEAARAPTALASVPRSHSDLAAILYSSGTTGKPKGVMLTHGNLEVNARALHQTWGFEPDDVLLHTLPIFHTHGLFVAINTVLLNGTKMIFHAKFSANAVIADLANATVFMGVPTYYVRLLASKTFTIGAWQNVRLFLCGSAPLLDETFRAFEFQTGRQIVERYGMTEAGIITSADVDKPRKAGDVGWPLPGVTLRIADSSNAELPHSETGEVQIKGPGLFKGYWRNPEKTAEEFTPDGFFKTGDLAYAEESGMVTIVGRAKDMMISGGFNVYPKEIESIIDRLPGVAESAVVGMPHPDFGEAGLAVVTMDVIAKPIDTHATRAILKKHLASYKIPKLFVVANELPRNAMGKVQKALLRESYKDSWNAFLNEART
jgi:malonyl-CoA/methylmalonyl-CoA synthetase